METHDWSHPQGVRLSRSGLRLKNLLFLIISQVILIFLFQKSYFENQSLEKKMTDKRYLVLDWSAGGGLIRRGLVLSQNLVHNFLV